jgi:hypothetical protein
LMALAKSSCFHIVNKSLDACLGVQDSDEFV